MRTFTLILAMMLSGMLLQAQTGEPCPGEPTVTYDGQTYNTILVGDRCWLKENLNVGTMILSEQNQSDNGLIEKYCYGDLPANCETYGGFYQWREAMQYDFTPGAQGICPPTGGWRIPTDDEWKMLEGAADSQYDYGDPEWDNMNFRGSDAGKNLKAQNGWLYNGNGFDILGAAVLPGGHRDLCSAYYSEGHSNYLWTATQQDDNTAWYRILASSTAKVSRRYAHNNMAASVRCVKDYEPAPTTYNLNLEVSPADAGTVTGAGQYEAGELVSITAEANTGWDFVNWTDDDGIVSEGANFTYTMPAEDITLTANFVEEQVGFNCGDTLIDSRDGQSYTTVLIGDQCWMAENLNIGTMINGYQEMTNNGIIEKYCYNNLESNCDLYGSLYQWDEMMSYTTTPGVQGICPEGWHVPTYNEWTVLTDYLGGENVAGGKMKSTRTEPDPHPRWNSPNTGATNSSSWSGLPGGYRSTYGDFSYLGNSGYWWSSTEAFSWDAWECGLICHSANAIRGVFNKELGIIVRCVWDYTQPTTYNLNLEVSPAGAGTVTGAGQYEAGEEVNLTAEANTSWEFVNWTDDNGIVSETENFVYTMPAKDVTLTANFVEEQTGFTCGDSFTDSRDGQSYETVQIGDQCWMAENLAYLPEVSPSSQGNNTDPYYYAYGYQGTDVNAAKATDNYNNYGALYNWPASLNACPEGWHLPTDAEWTFLTTYLGGQSVAGGKMKSTRTAPDPHPRWQSPNTGATNSSGFTGLPGGYRDSDGDFYYIGNYGTFWSSTEYSTTYAWYRTLFYEYAYVNRTYTTKAYGFGVRCLRD